MQQQKPSFLERAVVVRCISDSLHGPAEPQPNRSDLSAVGTGRLIFWNQGVHVFAIDEQNGAVQRRDVRAGIYGANGVGIGEDVDEGEVVVTEGRHRLTNGARVEASNSKKGAASERYTTPSRSRP